MQKGVLVCMYTVKHIDYKYYKYGWKKKATLVSSILTLDNLFSL